MSCASSNMPVTAMLKMFSSCEYICARWKALILPCGDSMNTRTPCLPRIAYSAAEPVSPDVAPRMLMVSPRLASTYSEQVAEQLHRHVLEGQRRTGQFEQAQPTLLQPMNRRDVACLVALAHVANTPRRYRSCHQIAARSAGGMSVMNFDRIAKPVRRRTGHARHRARHARHLRVGLRQVKAAVRRRTAQQDVAELGVGRLAGVATE